MISPTLVVSFCLVITLYQDRSTPLISIAFFLQLLFGYLKFVNEARVVFVDFKKRSWLGKRKRVSSQLRYTKLSYSKIGLCLIDHFRYLVPLFQNESVCKTIHMKISSFT